MKYNRILCILLALAMISLTGCASVKDMSEDHADLVAEYAAGVLLRYSDTYERRLITKKQAEKEGDTEAELASSQPSVSPSASPSASATASATASASPSVSPDGEPTQSSEQTNTELSDLFGIKGVTFTYDSYEFTNAYGTSQIRADDDECLMVVTFIVKNTTGKKKKIDLTDRNQLEGGMQYELDVDGSKYEPGLSIIENGGLNFLSTTLGPRKSEEAVLIYRMSKDKENASSIQLKLSEGDRQSTIQLK